MPAYTAVSVNVLLAFGLRIGELCALRVDNSDFDRMVVHIRHSIRRGPDDTCSVLVGRPVSAKPKKPMR